MTQIGVFEGNAPSGRLKSTRLISGEFVVSYCYLKINRPVPELTYHRYRIRHIYATTRLRKA
jgi:hypothetical protein